MEQAKKEWYVVNTYAGHENRVKDNLEKHNYTEIVKVEVPQ